jgi:hypothetical protein
VKLRVLTIFDSMRLRANEAAFGGSVGLGELVPELRVHFEFGGDILTPSIHYCYWVLLGIGVCGFYDVVEVL